MSQTAEASPKNPVGVVFTDLDGTLLDHESYRPSVEAVSLLRELSHQRILIVPVTSKTAAEVRPLMADLDLAGAAVVEGGTIIIEPCGTERLVGISRRHLVEVLETLQRAGLPLRGMSEMSVAEVSGLTGLEPRAAEMAMTRSASEPFVVTGNLNRTQTNRMEELAESSGAELARGGRFWHLHGAGVNKGTAVRLVLDGLDTKCEERSAAVGDAWNDLAMLAEVRFPFLLGDTVASHQIPDSVIRIPTTGPDGFVEAVRRVLRIWGAPTEE